MSAKGPWRAATLEWLSGVVEEAEGVDLRCLQPFTTLLVQTVNSVYRVVTIAGPEVYVQGGVFPDPTAAYLDGSSIGGSCLRIGWIGIGLRIEFRSQGRRFITSPVLTITAAQASGIAH